MMNNISRWAINHPIPTAVLFIVLSLAGIYGYTALRINQSPDIDAPTVLVSVSLSGASASELETQVTQVIENAVAGVSGVDSMSSSVSEGASTTTISFFFGTDIGDASDDVRNAVTGVQSQLPEAATTPTIEQLEISGGAIITYVIAAPAMSPDELSWYVDNDLADEINDVQGVAAIERSGGVERLVSIELDSDRLAALGLSASDVSQALATSNVDRPAGRVTLNGVERTVRTLGNADSVEALAELRIRAGGQDVLLSDLGTINDTWAEPRQRARLDGKEVVAFSVSRSVGSSELAVTQAVRHKVEQIDAADDTITITEVTSSADFVQESYDAAIEALLLGAALAVAIVYLFLRDFRATLVSAVAIPLSLIPTFAVMAWLDMSLNTISLLALSLVVGILVDDAIVEIENIVRHMRESGKSAKEAALEAADEIGLAVVATTSCLVAVFVPVAFMPGIAGQFFASFGIAVAVSVIFSLIVARMLTPLMGAYLIKAGHVREDTPRWVPGYLWLLRLALRFRWITLLLGFGFFAGSIVLATQLSTEFLPASDRGRSIISVELTPGSTLAQTDQAVLALTAALSGEPEVKSIFATIGAAVESGGGPNATTSNAAANSANITVNLSAERSRSQQEFEADLAPVLRTIPGVRASFGGGGFSGSGVSVTLTSADSALLAQTRDQVRTEMAGIPGLRSVASEAALARPELIVTPDADRAAELGITAAQIAESVNIATLGDSDVNLSKLNLGDRQVSIRVSLAPQDLEDLERIGLLPISGAAGAIVPLNSIATLSLEEGPSTISRTDGKESATIDAELNGITLGQAEGLISKLPTLQNLPTGVQRVLQGDSEELATLISGFLVAIGTAILLIYLSLVLLFGTFFQPITILVALPLSIGGALGFLYLTGNSIGLTTLIGILMLLGIAAKNSILLVEYAIVAQAKGVDRVTALLDAASKRARPIIMTSVAMAGGMVPIALGIGADAETRAPMAIAVIGGLISSTLLSLVFVPVVYTFMQDLELRVASVLSRLLVEQKSSSTPSAEVSKNA